MKHKVMILILLLCTGLYSSAAEEKLSCSLLTVGPGKALYSLVRPYRNHYRERERKGNVL